MALTQKMIDNARRIFVVRTSDDGNIGVFSNKKRVWDCIVTYSDSGRHKVSMTYQKMCKHFVKYSICSFDMMLYGDTGCYYGKTEITVQEFKLNI